VKKIECEVMVSDFEGTASKVDVVAWHDSGKATLFDIKTTSKFDRPYFSLQLSVYKRLFEENYGTEVKGLFVLGSKAKRSFRILEQESAKVRKILQMNKA
jgi:RecB family endonuclease NucS